MSEVVLVALIGFAGTLAGSFMGVIASAKLTSYRIEQLEKKVEKHNQVAERTTILERDLKTVFRLIDEIREREE